MCALTVFGLRAILRPNARPIHHDFPGCPPDLVQAPSAAERGSGVGQQGCRARARTVFMKMIPAQIAKAQRLSQRNEILKKKYKYCDDNDYKDDACQALSSQFNNRQKFESFYSSLNDDKTKDEFLRVGSSYLFFVKNGDWHVHDVPRSNSLIEYFTNSFKLVALLAIIESLFEKKNIDFFEWLSEKDRKNAFPIRDRSQLRKLYDEYKREYGSIRRCKSFFANLSAPTQDKLCKSIIVDGAPASSIETVVTMIYKVRSCFAHESYATLEISNSMCFSIENNKRVAWNLPMQLLQSSFEEGVMAHFQSTAVNQRSEA
jgi:hypothetical protein